MTIRQLQFKLAQAGSLAVLCSTLLPGAPEPAHRLRRSLQNAETVQLESSVPPRAQSATDLGSLPDSFAMPRMVLHFKMTAAQQADLAALLKRQADRTSPDYHRWLTPEQFGARFGMASSDLEKVRQWLESNGLNVAETARSKNWISFEGTAAAVKTAFGTSLHRYSANGVEHFANASGISLPADLNGVIESVRGLNSFHPKPRLRVLPRPHFTSNISGFHFIAPDDFATIYNTQPLLQSGIDGTGQKIAVVGQTDIALADIRAFRQAAGLPANDPQVVVNGTDPGTVSADLGEADLDVEWAGAVAPGATVVYVVSSDAFNSAIYAVTNNLASVISISYGVCEAQISSTDANTLSTTFQQGNAQGITVVAAGSDYGPADCDSPTGPNAKAVTSATQGYAVDIPGSLPSVTAMGGTTFQEGAGASYWSSSNNGKSGSAQSYIPEVSWNDTALQGELAASGGGKSTLFAKPSWQRGLNVPADGQRDLPDVSFAASPNHDGYLICSGGDCVNGFRNTDTNLDVVGGTSVSAPTFAGVIALLNQQTKTRQGNVNPNLYSLASLSTNAFHDITQGDNLVPCTTGSPGCGANGTIGFSAGPGYDQVTGLGTVDASNMVMQWGSDFNVAIAPATLTVNAGRSNTAAVQISALSGFAGAVTFTCTVSGALPGTTCSVPGTVTGSGSTTLTVSAASSAQETTWLRWPGAGRIGTGWPLLLALALSLTALTAFSPARRRPQIFAGCITLLLIASLSACDDGGSSSEKQTSVTGTVMVTGNSGIESHSATVTVTVP